MKRNGEGAKSRETKDRTELSGGGNFIHPEDTKKKNPTTFGVLSGAQFQSLPHRTFTHSPLIRRGKTHAQIGKKKEKTSCVPSKLPYGILRKKQQKNGGRRGRTTVANNKGAASSSSAREVCRSAAGDPPPQLHRSGFGTKCHFLWQYVIFGEMSSAGNANPNGTPFARL
ncbi:hypothetical protein niasHT_029567 [Heterodera trifolii]|uniref:Uncharacterized protein n=1 Tax=Heterodera trifolii TaxID=157864 RepID=A0ABD2JBE5_9BILA